MAKDENTEIPRHPTAAERLKKHLKLHKGRPDVLKAVKHREEIRKRLEQYIQLGKDHTKTMKERAKQKVKSKAKRSASKKRLQTQLDELVGKEEIEVIS